MDQRSNKRVVPGGRHATPNQSAQPCSRTGCSGRINLSQNTRIKSSGKAVCTSPSTSGNEIARKPLGSRSVLNSEKKPCHYSKRKVDFPKHITEGKKNMPAPFRNSELGQFNRKNTVERKNLEGESSSSHRKVKTKSATSPVSTRRPLTVNTGSRLPSGQNGRRNELSVREPAATVYRIPDRSFPPVVGRNNGGDQPSAAVTSPSSGHEFTQSVHDEDDDDVFRHVGGITEMLLTLERLEQDLQLTHEDLVALETTLFLGSHNLYDQHREMRLDIDAMSYEELLALEERMGTVSTPLPQEALSKCLMRSVYEVDQSKSEFTGPVDDDGDSVKCCICQEEYVTGDELGTLVKCQHGYHATCLNRWLQLKNWCPICKTPAAPSQSPSSL